MLGRSVIDVSVGPNTTLKDGFFIVVLRKHNEADCKAKEYDLSIDGIQDPFEYGRKISKINKTNIEMNIHITSVDNEVTKISLIITGTLFGILIITATVSQLPGVEITGTVLPSEKKDVDIVCHSFPLLGYKVGSHLVAKSDILKSFICLCLRSL